MFLLIYHTHLSVHDNQYQSMSVCFAGFPEISVQLLHFLAYGDHKKH